MLSDPTWSPLKDDPEVSPIDKQANRVQSYQRITYHYDELGNMVRKEAEDKTLELSYNLNQQLIAANITHSSKIEKQESWRYIYDVFGRRIRKEQISNHATQNKTEFIWDGARLLQESTDKRTFTYIYREEGFEPLAQIVLKTSQEEPQINYLHTDQVGLPKELTDEKGELIWYAKYQIWGKVSEEHNLHQGHQLFRFQNQYYDAETGLHYNLMRYYDADSGRFSNQDPIGLMGGDNLYQYAPNPMGWMDPWGTKPINLPSLKKLSIDMKHILERHTSCGVIARRRSDDNSLFPENMNNKQIENSIKEAYKNLSRVQTQGDRVLLQGHSGKMKIEMWLNTATKTIETAYPKGFL